MKVDQSYFEPKKSYVFYMQDTAIESVTTRPFGKYVAGVEKAFFLVPIHSKILGA